MPSEGSDEGSPATEHRRSPHAVFNPFVAQPDALSTIYDRLKVALLTVSLLPVRVAGVCVFVLVGWLLACIGTFGLTEAEQCQPLRGWRDAMRRLQALNARLAYYFSGWVVRTRGQLARDAPLLLVAPHSSYFDGIALFCSGLPSIVVRSETRDLPLMGRLVDFTRPVYVSRDDPDSRRSTLREIQERARSGGAWPQLMIFPEGTCTNRSCLVRFKPGAFCPGVAVQPVLLRFPNRCDTVTWTWRGAGAWQVLWLTLTQLVTFCEVEYLPVYEPSEDERRDPQLFAENVRAVMAAALELPVADYTYDDCRLMSRACDRNLPAETGLVEISKQRRLLGVDRAAVEAELDRFAAIAGRPDGLVRLTELAAYLALPPSEPALAELFRLYDTDQDGVLTFLEFLTGVYRIARPANTPETLAKAFRVLDVGGKGHVTQQDLVSTLEMSGEESDHLFGQVDKENAGYVTFEEFCVHAEKKPEYAKIFIIWHSRKTRK